MRRLALALAVLASVTACGTESRIKAADVGTVCEGAQDRPIGLSRVLAPREDGPSWTRIQESSQLSRGRTWEDGGPAFQEVHLRGAPSLRGPSRPTVRFTKRAVDEAVSELGRGASIVAVVDDPVVGQATPVSLAVASVRSDASVVFLGECAGPRFTRTFQSFVDARHAVADRRSAGDLLVALASDPALVGALKEVEYPTRTEPAWNDVPAERRVIDPDGDAPPPEVMKGLRPRWVYYAFPKSWKGFEGSVAVFVPGVGWNALVPFGLDSREPSIVSYVPVDGPAEVWALDAKGRIGSPLARLAVLRTADLDGDVKLTGVIEASSYDDLVRQARAGATVFTVERAVAH